MLHGAMMWNTSNKLQNHDIICAWSTKLFKLRYKETEEGSKIKENIS